MFRKYKLLDFHNMLKNYLVKRMIQVVSFIADINSNKNVTFYLRHNNRIICMNIKNFIPMNFSDLQDSLQNR